MSGGVDSSAAAVILQQQGYQVVGCFMRHGGAHPEPEDSATCDPNKSHKQGCCSVDDASDARLVAAMLDIPLYVLNFEKQFDRIIDYFVSEYNAGRTPNPCVRCNDWLKFGKLFEYADSINADYVATGHYARIQTIDGVKHLTRGRDLHKDQSYVLFGTPRHRLDRMLLPIGEFENKAAIRAVAQQRNLPVFNKPDSQEICFVPDQNYARVVAQRSATENKPAPGPIIDTQGQELGQHDGHQHYTIGQRRGLSISLGHPIYVVDKNPSTNTVTVGLEDDLLAASLTADQVNWLDSPPHSPSHSPSISDTETSPDSTDDWQPCTVKIRSNMPPTPGQYRLTPPPTHTTPHTTPHNPNHQAGDTERTLHIKFDPPIRAVSPGQAVVCYDHQNPDRVLGGAWIQSATPPHHSPA